VDDHQGLLILKAVRQVSTASTGNQGLTLEDKRQATFPQPRFPSKF